MVLLVGAQVLIALIAVSSVVILLQMQAATSAYVASGRVWSRAQLATVHHLYRYLHSGDDAQLAQARNHLAIPLRDLAARRAMEQDPPDIDAARAALVGGSTYVEDRELMIWLFRNFMGGRVLREPMRAWRTTDPMIERLAALVDESEALWDTEMPSPEAVAALQRELLQLDEVLRPLSDEFAAILSSSSRKMARQYTMLMVLILGFLAIVATGIGRGMIRIMTTAEGKFRAIFEQAAVGIAHVDPEGLVVEVNDTLLRLTGRERADVLGGTLDDLLPSPEDGGATALHLPSMDGPDRSLRYQRQLLREGRTDTWIQLTVSAISRSAGAETSYIIVVEDISDARAEASRLSYLANHDPLTDLINRRRLRTILEEVLQASRRSGDEHVLCFVDLDNFKEVNDQSGHAAGDEVLRDIANLFRRQVRASDVVARMGGDEFALLLRGCDLEQGQRLAETLRRALENLRIERNGRHFPVTCSVGLVHFQDDRRGPGDLLRQADRASYEAKAAGGNCVVIATDNDAFISGTHSRFGSGNRPAHPSGASLCAPSDEDGRNTE